MHPGGTIPGFDNAAAFTLERGSGSAPPILLAVPHDGRTYPPSVVETMRSPAVTCVRLEDRRVGDIADLIADQLNVSLLKAHAPRAMIDLNRSTNDIDWGMVANARGTAKRNARATYRSRHGLGLIPRRISGVGEIWRRPVDQTEIDQRIAGIHGPYHSTMQAELQRLHDKHGMALLVDLHSMPPLKPQSIDAGAPEFVIGDRFGASCAAELSDAAIGFLVGKGRRGARNRPYAGGYILDRHGQPRRGIHAMQIEICRSLYLDAALDRPTPKLPAIARLVAGLIALLGTELRQIVPPRDFLQAAE